MSKDASASRRSMLAALGIGSLGLALAPQMATGRTQDTSLSDHPIVGAWHVQVALPTAPDVTVTVASIYFPNGTVINSYPVTEATPRGVMHKSISVGAWEAIDERTVHMTAIQSLASPEGNFMGTVMFDVHPQVSEDGQTFIDQNPDNLVTIRDASNTVINEIPGGSAQPVTGYRITPGNVPFPEPTGGATPTG